MTMTKVERRMMFHSNKIMEKMLMKTPKEVAYRTYIGQPNKVQQSGKQIS